MGHLRKADSGRWEARYRGADGREHSRRFSTEREAQAFLERTGADLQRGEWRDPQGAKVPTADWIDAWWATTVQPPAVVPGPGRGIHPQPRPPRLRGAAPRGGHAARRAGLGGRLGRSGSAPATVQKAYQTLSKIFRGAVDAGLIAQSPCRRIALPRVEREEMRFLTPAEIGALAEAIEPRYRAMVLFDAYCGLRLGELAGLRRGARGPTGGGPGTGGRRSGRLGSSLSGRTISGTPQFHFGWPPGRAPSRSPPGPDTPRSPSCSIGTDTSSPATRRPFSTGSTASPGARPCPP